MSEECISSCFHSLNNKKMRDSLEKSSVVCIQRCAFVSSLCQYCHQCGQHLHKIG